MLLPRKSSFNYGSSTLLFSCDFCSKAFARHPSNVVGGHDFCSRECYHKFFSTRATTMSEIDSMSLHQLGLSTDYAPLLRAAREQNWIVRKATNGHIKWIPPRGQAVHTSGTPSDKNACHQVRRDLIRAGLRIDGTEPEPTKPTSPLSSNESSSAKKQRRMGLIWDIETMLREANRPMRIDDIRMKLSIKHPGIKNPDFLPSLTKLLAKGYIVRREMGVYQHKSEQKAEAPPTPIPAPQPPLEPLPPGPMPPGDRSEVVNQPVVVPSIWVEQQPTSTASTQTVTVDPEEVIIDRALQALADLEGLLKKMKRRTAQYRKLKALLDQVEVDGE